MCVLMCSFLSLLYFVGISSYGVSMTTLEEVFLHLERDEETEGTMDNLSKKMVRNRALSRSLSLQSKSTSYQSLHNEANMNATDGKGKIKYHSIPIHYIYYKYRNVHNFISISHFFICVLADKLKK